MKLKRTFRLPHSLFAFVFSFFSVSSVLLAQTTVVNVFQTSYSNVRTGSGTTTYTVPPGGPYVYKITAIGGKGGDVLSGATVITNGGRAAVISGKFSLQSGTQLAVIAGSNGTRHISGGAGGGGSSGVYVVGVGSLLVAGGGGGAAYTPSGSYGGVDAGGFDNSNTANGGSGIIGSDGGGVDSDGTDGNTGIKAGKS
jgi:hypothetical protein